MSRWFNAADQRISARAWALILLTLALIGAFYGYNLGGRLNDDDEGSYLYQTWQITLGEMPYRDFLTPQQPLFLFSGATVMRLLGPDVLAVRAVGVVLILAAGLFVCLIGQELFSLQAGLVAMSLFLLHPDVYRWGRMYRPEAYMLCFSTSALYVYVIALNRSRRDWLWLSGLLFGLSTLYKLFGILLLGGCLLALAIEVGHGRLSWRTALGMGGRLVGPSLTVVTLVMAVFILCIPEFSGAVLGHQLRQGKELGWEARAIRTAAFFIGYFMVHAFLLLLAFLGGAWARKHSDVTLRSLAVQLLTPLSFLLLSRELFPRHLMYLLPVLSLLFVAALQRLLKRPLRSFYWAVSVALLISWLGPDIVVALDRDLDTPRVVEHIRAHTAPSDVVLSDYAGLNFFARRPSTYYGASLSQGATSSGQITGADLIAEIEEADVKMVLVDVSPQTAHQMVNLWDYDDFRAYLQQHFTLLDVLPRGSQMLEVYCRER